MATCGGESGGPHEQSMTRGHGGRSDAQIRLNPDEVRVLQECNRESFYYRCIPISTTAMIATHYAVSFGYLRRSANYGSLFKVLGAGVIGYFVGKFSYRSACEEKIMQLSNSHLADLLRRRKNGQPVFSEALDYAKETMQSVVPDSQDAQGQTVGLGGRGTWEINAGDNVDFQGMDDLQRPSMDNPMLISDDEKTAQAEATYEALRKRNREEYEARHTNIYDRNRSEQRTTTSVDQSRLNRTSVSSSAPGIRNKYGDLVE